MKITPSQRVKVWREKQIEKYIKNHPERFESLPAEVFIDIRGYEGEYQVSNKGRIKSLKTKRGRIMLTKTNVHGYTTVCLCQGNVKRHHTVHSLVLEAFVSPRPDGLVVNHIDGDKSNNDVSNLEWVTQSENAKHSYYVLGHNEHCVPPHFYGEEHPLSLNRETAEQIAKTYESGLSSREVGRQFGTSKTTVMKIVNHKHWSNNV